MIQANELRIGNLVGLEDTALQTDYQKEIFKEMVFKIEQLTEHVAHVSGLYLGEYYKDLKPIPITEERLLKFGFGKEWETASGVTAKIINEECFYHKLSDLVIFMKSEIRDIYYPFVNIAKRDVKIQYVHQLQNLYFILNGEELTYSDVI